MTPGIAMTQTQLARTGSSGGQTNDVVTSETTVELYHGGPAYLVYYGIQVYLNNAKAHGMSPSVNGRSGSSGNAYVVESISGCTISGEVDYGAKLNSGHLLVGGASTKVLWRDFVIYASAPSNFGLVHVTSGHTDTRVLLGPGYSNTRRTAHPVVYGANAQDDAVRSGGHVLRRFETDSQQTVTELVAAISSNAQKSIADDAFVVITPPQNVKVGILVLWSSANSTSSILRFRTTASGYGVHMEGVALASNCEVATGDLTGTAGTDVKVTVSAATDGTIHVENRIGYGAVFSWLFLGTPGI
jgi:hypothetical protein